MNCIEKSIAIYHTTGAAIAGTPVPVPDPDGMGNVWKTMTVINDTDQDVKVAFKSTMGYDFAFIVPKSIKGYTKTIKTILDNTSLVVSSMSGTSAAAGNITFNLGN